MPHAKKKDLICECGNCGKRWKLSQLAPLEEDYWPNAEPGPGSIIPHGRCPDPDCGCSCWSVEPEETIKTLCSALHACKTVISAYLNHKPVEMCAFAEAFEDAKAALAQAKRLV